MADFSVADELIKLKSLVDAGVLTQEEFDKQKDKLLNNNTAQPQTASPNTEQVFDVILTEVKPDSKINVIKVVREITGFGIVEAKDLVENPPRVLKSNVSAGAYKVIQKRLADVGGITETRATGTRPKEKANALRCPNCGSTAITTGARGVNFTWGLIGASKTVNRCAKCGKTWTPGK